MRPARFLSSILPCSLAAALALALGVNSAAAQTRALGKLVLLQGDTLYSAFSGRTMDGTYKNVRARTGTAQFTESFLPSGDTIYREGKITAKGRWKLSGPPGFETIICFTYNSEEMAGPPSCFTVFKNGTCLYSYAPKFIQGGKPIDGNLGSAKTVIRGQISSCDDLIS